MKTLLSSLVVIVFLCVVPEASAGRIDKVEVCHVRPGDPNNGKAHTISISPKALAAHLAHGDTEGPCGLTAAEIDPPEVTVDPGLITDIQIEGIDDGDPRNLIRMTSEIGAGYQFDFVENEIYLITDRVEDLSAFLSRWNGELLFQVNPLSVGPGEDSSILYLISVDPSTADSSTLNEDLAILDPRIHGIHHVSSEAALNLLALVASEIRDYGLNVGINVLLESQGLAERSTQEAAIGVDVTLRSSTFVYTRNGFEWPYMERDPDMPDDSLWPLDTGVAEALRVVEAAGGLGNRVRALIADGGFYPNEDFPPFTNIGSLRTPNPDPTNCGFAGPITATCSAHGTHVTLAGFALPDNSFGTFGPGGPVTDLILLQSPSVDFSSIVRFITESIPEAIALRPNILNISASVSIPGGWCFIVCEPLDFLASQMDRMGIVFVAAAGNAGINVDATDEICFFGCIRFEEAAIIPCETDHVLCVGANTFSVSVRTGYSNFGTAEDANSVDIYAPGDVYSVTALNADETAAVPVDDLQIINGTSFASPFTAGVVALTWASNPSLTDDEVKNCIMSSAHTVSLGGEPRRINALGAVQCAMGGTHPFVEIIAPINFSLFQRAVESVVLLADADDLEDGLALTIGWTSSLEGYLGSSSPGEGLTIGPLRLRVGSHELCASTTDSSGRSSSDCIGIIVITANPIVAILEPFDGASFNQASDIGLFATVTDPDGSTLTTIHWFIDPPFSDIRTPPVATGTLDTSVPASGYALGDYEVTLFVEDDLGGFAYTRVMISITASPTNALPVISITDPEPGETFMSDGGPVTIPLSATALDVEDGSIPFDQIQWFVSTEDGPEQPLTVNSTTICVEFDPFGGCTRFVTSYSVQLGPLPGFTTTRHLIKGRVSDGDGQENEESNGRVTIFINQLI